MPISECDEALVLANKELQRQLNVARQKPGPMRLMFGCAFAATTAPLVPIAGLFGVCHFANVQVGLPMVLLYGTLTVVVGIVYLADGGRS